jgi:hypothetical protein
MMMAATLLEIVLVALPHRINSHGQFGRDSDPHQ